MSETEVKVVKYPDRKNLVLRWIDPETGKPKGKTSGTTRRREAERAAAKLEADLWHRHYRAFLAPSDCNRSWGKVSA